MPIWLNGVFRDEKEANVGVSDRGFLYGDGLFETLRAYRGRVFRLEQHWDRLAAGAAHLGLRLPLNLRECGKLVEELLLRNEVREAIVRIQLTRGPGPRGYSPGQADQPTLLLTTHALAAPPAGTQGGWELIVSSRRLPSFDPTHRFKTCNRLPQILARREAEQQRAHEALLLNEKDHMVEVAGANLFWLADGVLYTPALSAGPLPGITRAVLIEIAERLDLECVETHAPLANLLAADAAFLTQTALEIGKVATVSGTPLGSHPLIDRLAREFQETVARETR